MFLVYCLLLQININHCSVLLPEMSYVCFKWLKWTQVNSIIRKEMSYNHALYFPPISFVCNNHSGYKTALIQILSLLSSWTTWLIPAIAATVVGILCRIYMLEHKSSWVLASCLHPILFIWRPSNVWPNPPYTEYTHLEVCASSAAETGGAVW